MRSLTSEHGVVHATVRGSIDYDVWIEPQGALIRAVMAAMDQLRTAGVEDIASLEEAA